LYGPEGYFLVKIGSIFNLQVNFDDAYSVQLYYLTWKLNFDAFTASKCRLAQSRHAQSAIEKIASVLCHATFRRAAAAR
jgi:hypothetical protein